MEDRIAGGIAFGAHPWILERRNGHARGIPNRKVADAGKQTLATAKRRLHTLISGGGYSAYQLVFASNSAYLRGWEDKDEDLLFPQDTSLPEQFAQQWKQRMVAREAVLGEAANIKLRRSLA